ncbi:unnamed protein product [Ectocarpus fasciculatus]
MNVGPVRSVRYITLSATWTLTTNASVFSFRHRLQAYWSDDSLASVVSLILHRTPGEQGRNRTTVSCTTKITELRGSPTKLAIFTTAYDPHSVTSFRSCSPIAS